MKLQSKVNLSEYDFNIHLKSKILSLGSCFSENIGSRLQELWFDIQVNPYGIIFNPISISNLIYRSINEQLFSIEEVEERDGVYFLYDLHSKTSALSPEEVIEKANEALIKTKEYIQQADFIFITFGTAFYFELKNNKKVVGNCHKMPSNLFDRKKIETNEIVEIYQSLIQKIESLNPNVQFIFTVSPVRHSRDGFIANNRSKANLILALEAICKRTNAHYFPSYEIQMDELRDYRFYKEDLNHPNKIALDYIFQSFSSTFFDQQTQSILKEIRKVNLQEQHRPLQPESKTYIESQKKLIETKKNLQEKIRSLNL